MFQIILLVIAVFLLVAFTHKLILKDKVLIEVQKGCGKANFLIEIILISIALSYIIWYCN